MKKHITIYDNNVISSFVAKNQKFFCEQGEKARVMQVTPLSSYTGFEFAGFLGIVFVEVKGPNKKETVSFACHPFDIFDDASNVVSLPCVNYWRAYAGIEMMKRSADYDYIKDLRNYLHKKYNSSKESTNPIKSIFKGNKAEKEYKEFMKVYNEVTRIDYKNKPAQMGD